MAQVERQTWLETSSVSSNRLADQTMTSDLEKNSLADDQLTNRTVQSFAWRRIHVTVKDRETKAPKSILTDVNGSIRPGELLALMGPR
jgi:hypothetical protein